jgi:uncharacterized protein YndB with AHSA1/START domain
MLKNTIIGAAVIFVVVTLGGYLLPAKYEASRSIDINAPLDLVFSYVNNPRKGESWSPWLAADPTTKVTYNDVAEGQGAAYTWTGENSGEGKATITESSLNQKIVMALDFKDQGLATAVWTFTPSGSGVKATWALQGDAGMNPLARYVGLMIDSLIGPVFEDGLTRLKKVAEEQAKAA